MMSIGFRGVCVTVLASLLVSASGRAAKTIPVTIAAAGDIACDTADPSFNGGAGTATRCHMRQTSDLLVGRRLRAVLALGDLQYSCASAKDFQASFDPTWGRVKKLIRPVPGNHEYIPYPDGSGVNDCAEGGAAYFDYFGRAAGDRSKGYYSFNLGSWHLIAVNSECFAIGGCQRGSPEEVWLRRDLARSRARCTLAFWHESYLTSAGTPNRFEEFRAFWDDLVRAGVEVVLTGHHHNYERFAPVDPDGQLDRKRGVREFVVGTGGSTHSPILGHLPASRVRNDQTFGVLLMTLAPKSYSWRFVPELSATFSDSGSAKCH
jgi:hypothetical protein